MMIAVNNIFTLIRRYYYNPRTKVSTWDRPPGFEQTDDISADIWGGDLDSSVPLDDLAEI